MHQVYWIKWTPLQISKKGSIERHKNNDKYDITVTIRKAHKVASYALESLANELVIHL